MIACPKPSSRLLTKARADRKAASLSKAVKRAVMERDDRTCRVCRKRAAHVHELHFRSLGGVVSLENSIAVCVRCHTQLQANALIPIGRATGRMRFLDNARGRKR